ncbi:DUF4265 domain-containing protein [Stenotrophomonas maltophilia]|uniref:DUF4265 domain-containing protein n=1 Tax=Stenotrophomonas maltophilia TaxID=40324 RepID=UPI0009B28168|nr:DUF4265 domain-containing protein [Stenotrophomonas maltophilia]HDS1083180.1 DUF4265 domain-containing protein [Stenotrophomonas maltophilia]
MSIDQYVKILFRLPKQNGYPPVEWEGLWALPQGEGYRIDNVPFYARLVSFGDVVFAAEVNGDLVFDGVKVPGGHSTIRVISYSSELVSEMRGGFESLGCSTELSNIETFFSVDVPPEVDYQRVVDLLSMYAESGALDYEEASIQHDDASGGL